MSNDSLTFAKLAAAAADDKLGKNIIAYDVRQQNAVADIYMFVGATSHIHVRALEDAVRESLKGTAATLLRTDGQRGHLWRVLDYGSVMIHIMDEKTREFYSVERLWEQGRKIQLLKTAVVSKKAPAKAKKKSAKKSKTPKKKPAKKKSKK